MEARSLGVVPLGARRIVVTMATRAICGFLLICAALASGCGSSDKQAKTTATTPAKPAAGSAEKVIRGWADAHRRGDMKAAARYFAVPSTISNGGAPVKLLTQADIVFFNTTLPCGAKILSTAAVAHGFTLTTFELTERPGAGKCGSGTGGTARVAFRVRMGKITDWRRASDPPKVPQETA